MKRTSFCVLVLKGLVGLHRTVQLQLLQGYWYESANVSELYLPYGYMVLNFFIKLFNFSFFSITGRSMGLDYRDIEWFALEMNRDHSVVFDCIQVLHFRLF